MKVAAVAAVALTFPLCCFGQTFPELAPAKDRTALSLATLQHEDFREYFCDHKKLQSRIDRQVAFVDQLVKNAEIMINEHDTVATLMAKVGLADLWKNSWQPQVRLITKDAIYQSPASFSKSAMDAFLSRGISPGDILIESMVD